MTAPKLTDRQRHALAYIDTYEQVSGKGAPPGRIIISRHILRTLYRRGLLLRRRTDRVRYRLSLLGQQVLRGEP